MAAGIGNSAGCIVIADGAAPRILTGIAGGNISGGAFVFASGTAGVVSSGTNSFVSSDIKFITDASGAQFNGVALQSAGSNTYVSVLTQGVILALVDGTTTAGWPQITAGVNAVRDFVGTGSTFDFPIGRAFTSAGSETYCILQVGL